MRKDFVYLASASPRRSELLRQIGVPFRVIGSVGGDRLRVTAGERTLIDESVETLNDIWTGAFARAMEAADVL